MASSIAEYKAYAAELYDVETRPTKVAEALKTLGAEKVLSKVGLINGKAEKVVTTLAAMSTVAGLLEKKDEAMEVAAPYIAKAKDAEGRKEIVEEVKALPIVITASEKLNEKVVEPVSARISAGKEYAAPYVASAKEYADPYVAKMVELRNSERVESMVTAFQQAREHPAEKMSELKAQAVDLIKYETLAEYRDYVTSAEFQADTIQLVKVDLPAIAASAAKRGAENLKATATTVTEEMNAYSAMYSEKIAALVPTEAERKILAEKLKEAATTLLEELKEELSSGVEHVKTEGFSLEDTVERLTRVVAIIDKTLVQPIKEKVKSPPAEEAEDEAAEAMTEGDDAEMHDANEEVEGCDFDSPEKVVMA